MKKRRKSETLTLGPDAALFLKMLTERFLAEMPPSLRSIPQVEARTRRTLGNQLLALACEAILDKSGPVTLGHVWWKLKLTEMSDEEKAAHEAMLDATLS